MNAGDTFRKEKQNNAEDFVQPTFRPDRMNGNKLKLDEAYLNTTAFKMKGNPFNDKPENKFSPYLEDWNDEEMEGHEKLLKSKSSGLTREDIKKNLVLQIRRLDNPKPSVQVQTVDNKPCSHCGAFSRKDLFICFNCLERI